MAKKESDRHEERKNRIVITLSDSELEALERYVRRYKAKSKTTVVREATLRLVMERFIEDYPTLFGKSELDRLLELDE